MTTTLARMKQRRGTAAQWTAVNPVLFQGEYGYETDLDGVKIADGTTPWNSLPFAVPYRGDITMELATISGGVATNGSIRRTQSVATPWAYSQSTNPTDAAVGTALHIPVNVDLSGGPAFVGPQLASGLPGAGGARGTAVNLEGVVRHSDSMQTFGPAPICVADSLSIVCHTNAATINPGLGFMYFRNYIADARSVRITGDVSAPIGSDPAGYGAAFIDSQSYGTLDLGTLDGLTDSFQITSFMSNVGMWGNTAIFRRVGLQVVGVGWNEGAAAGGSHWSGSGTFDTENCSVAEDIGVSIREFTQATLSIGVESEPPILARDGFFGGRASGANNLIGSTMHATRGRIQLRDLVSLVTENKTLTGAATVLDLPSTRTLTMASSGLLTMVQLSPTVVFEDDASAFGSGFAVNANVLLKNATGEAHALGTLAGWTTYQSAPLLRGDGAALTAPSVVGFRDGGGTDNAAGGTVTVTDWSSLVSAPSVGAGGTITTRRGVQVADVGGAGTLTTQIGIDVAPLAKATLNIGIRNASAYVATPTAQTLSAAGNAIVANAEVKALTNSTGGSLTLTSAPTIADGQNGQEVELVNVGTQDIVLQDQGTLASSNLRLTATTITLTPRDTVRLRYNSTIGDWVQSSAVVAVL